VDPVSEGKSQNHLPGADQGAEHEDVQSLHFFVLKISELSMSPKTISPPPSSDRSKLTPHAPFLALYFLPLLHLFHTYNLNFPFIFCLATLFLHSSSFSLPSFQIFPSNDISECSPQIPSPPGGGGRDFPSHTLLQDMIIVEIKFECLLCVDTKQDFLQ
jgi:hypothetical protein